MTEMEEKLRLLEENLRALGSVAVAFSGGVDSAFLLAAAHRVLGEQVLAVTACSCAFPKRDLLEAQELTEKERVRHRIFSFPIFEVEGFAGNPPDRCYHCKTAILKEIRAIAKEEGIAHIIEGSNADDAKDYRPGTRAIQEQGILSPLRDAGLTKAEIRLLSRSFGLSTWNKESGACLASRFAYGEPITEEKLWMVEQAEAFLKEQHFGQLRVRVHGQLARIELTEEDLTRALEPEFRRQLSETFKKIGFSYVTLDVQGYRMGSMNEVLTWT